MSLVSVIIPAYNGEFYIREAIASILAQTYTNYEIIIVDDGSTDNTRQVVEALKKDYKGSLIYIFQDNQGVAKARNKGLEAAKGKYIAFLDQDDFFLPYKLVEQVSFMEAKPDLGLVNSGWDIVNQAGKIISTVQPWHSLSQLNTTALIIWKPVFLGAMLFRYSWLQKTSGFDSQLEQTSDVELVLRLAVMGCQGDWVKQSTVGYRQHKHNASKNSLLQAKELNQMLEEFFARLNISSEIKALEAESRYQSLVWSAWRLYNTGYLAEMSHYLAQSCAYTDKYATEIVLDWIKYFKQYAAEYGTTINVNLLSNSSEWQQLIRKLLFLSY
ncbi:Glycosyl transferase family 2 [Hyella patelloides LEGE 07179]|uniref:Glycosyl transferase family 2 n=1 Tax=Hyella patelloides LEGE 07179 TaxID=945734 RepID=A0A563VMG8_9CYAN|nr:glycosyltransferase family A protein [Hyella patelloides]VEP12654.1 Glycosyl transferase family 2 [Hyella patelloides LEGE 07179]